MTYLTTIRHKVAGYLTLAHRIEWLGLHFCAGFAVRYTGVYFGMGGKKKGKEENEMNNCPGDTNNDRANVETSGVSANKKGNAQISDEKANEQDEGDPIVESENDTAKRNPHSSKEFVILGKGTENRMIVYLVLGMIWILSLFTRLYDISQPAKIWYDLF